MIRFIRQNRWYVGVASGTVAIAVGVNLVVLTIVNQLWLRPPPFPNADRVVTITGFSFADFNSPLLKPFEFAAGQVITTGRESGLRPELQFDQFGSVETIGVTPDYFRVVGLSIRGRDFNSEDDRPGAEPVAIISDRLWSRAFERRAGVIGHLIPAGPLSVRIVGVAPPHFQGVRRGELTDVWIPSNLVPRVAADTSGLFSLMAFGRLHRGQTPQDVRRSIEGLGILDKRSLADLGIVPVAEVFGTPTTTTIVIREGGIFGVVGAMSTIVLIGGCLTLATLVLVHYERRRRELAARIALGASRWHVVRLMCGELGVLTATGSTGAILVAVLGLSVMPALALPSGIDLGRLELAMDWAVLCVGVALTALSLFGAGLFALTRFTRPALARELFAGPAPTASISSQRVRQTLMALHVSATVVVLVSAGLFVRVVAYSLGSGPGFDINHTAFATIPIQVPYPRADVAGSMTVWRAAIAERVARLIDAIRSLPGVVDSATGIAPIGAEAASSLNTPTDVRTHAGRRSLLLGSASGSPELLVTLGVPILVGRGLTSGDTMPSAATVSGEAVPAVVTSSLAHALWPDQDPIGQEFTTDRRGRYRVVGVARDFSFGSLLRRADGVVVTAQQDRWGPEPRFVISARSPEALAQPLKKVVSDVAPGTPWLAITTGREIVARDVGRQRTGAWCFSWFGLTALALSVGGVFGLVAYLAESRKREFGVRLSLGATFQDLVRHAVSIGLRPVAAGTALGLVLAVWISRLYSSMLVGVGPLDPLTYAGVVIAVLGGTTLGSLAAVWRLRDVVPADALRTD